MSTAETTIAILGGTGPEGIGLALRWAQAGARILVGSRELEKARAVAQELRQQLPSGRFEGMPNAQAARAADAPARFLHGITPMRLRWVLCFDSASPSLRPARL